MPTRGFCVAPAEPCESPEPSAEHTGPRSPEFQVGPRVGAVRPCLFTSLILKSLGGYIKPGHEKRHISGHLRSHLSWAAVSTRISALGSGSFICLLPEPPRDAHPPGIFFLLYLSQKPFSDPELKPDSTTVLLRFTSGKAVMDTSSCTCNHRTADGGSRTIRVVLDSGCKATSWGLLASFSFRTRVGPRGISQRSKADLPLKSINCPAWLLTICPARQPLH